MIWAGDLNTNPTDSDWNPKAFEMIAHKIPKGTLPAGCREEDQRIYRDLLQVIDGVNVADYYTSERKGTCFQNEWYLDRGYGQRIDHIIAQKELINRGSDLRVTSFKTLQEFGGGPRGSSDHCPIFCKIERGDPQIVATVCENHNQSSNGDKLSSQCSSRN